MGSPVFYVRVIDSASGWPARADNALYYSEAHPERPTSVQNLTLDASSRLGAQALCGSHTTSLLGDGTQACLLAIGVTCGDGGQCAYRLKIEQEGLNSSVVTGVEDRDPTPAPPGPVLADGYTDGHVGHGEVKYYYFPVDWQNMGETMVLLNKTQIYATGENGDSKMLMNIESGVDESDHGWTTWDYPTNKGYGIQSATEHHTWPEIIEPCEQELEDQCGDGIGCALVVGVAGLTPDVMSSYRLKGFYGTNKLRLDEPVVKETDFPREGDEAFDYYWFVITDRVPGLLGSDDVGRPFEYQVSVGSEGGGDPDLFVSLMDGRSPTDRDHDFASTMTGADTIRISSADRVWTERGWEAAAGVVVVVGVRFPDAGGYTLLVTAPATAAPEVQAITVGERVEDSMDELTPSTSNADEWTELRNGTKIRSYSRVFQLYNWEHQDLQLALNMPRGQGRLMYHRTGQRDPSQNIYTAVPVNVNNSLEWVEVQQGETQTISVTASDCYGCWYFLRVEVPGLVKSSYRLTVSQTASSSGSFVHIAANDDPVDFPVVAGERDGQAKFMPDSMANVLLEVSGTGAVSVYVGLDAETVGEDDYLWSARSASAAGGETL